MRAFSRVVSANLFLWSLIFFAGCGGFKLPPITVVVPPPPLKPPVEPPPSNATPPEPATPVKPVEPPEPEPELPQLVNLNVVVVGPDGAGIPLAECSISGPTERGDVETRTADGGGFINFAVRGPVKAACLAPGYVARSAELPPGDHRFHLSPVAPTEPPKPVDPMPSKEACGLAANANGVSAACLDSVARTSVFYATCRITGAVEPCHYYVREVVRALNAHRMPNDHRWGLLRKTKGGDNVDGYGTDVVAFLPERFPLDAQTWQWLGVDVIGGIGEPNARFVAGNFNPVVSCEREWKPGMGWCNREGDLWAPVPK